MFYDQFMKSQYSKPYHGVLVYDLEGRFQPLHSSEIDMMMTMSGFTSFYGGYIR